MNKLEQMAATIEQIPEDMMGIKSLLRILFDNGDLQNLNAVVRGAYLTAFCLTSDEKVMKPLRNLRELLS